MKIKQIILLLFYVIISSCSRDLSIKTENEELVKTNGIYIAINNNTSSFSQLDKSIIPMKSIKIIRFINQNKGIIIPEQISESRLLDTVKIKKLYNWCLEFENKNSKDKSFIYINPKYKNDTIEFSQNSNEASIEYIGLNYKDSISISYKIIQNGNINIKLEPKKLLFKFYKVY
jgi:hypothetical protein